MRPHAMVKPQLVILRAWRLAQKITFDVVKKCSRSGDRLLGRKGGLLGMLCGLFAWAQLIGSFYEGQDERCMGWRGVHRLRRIW